MNLLKRKPQDRPLEPAEKARAISMTRDGYDPERIAIKLGVAITRVSDYLARPLESAERMLIRALSKDGHDSIYIARQLGAAPVVVAAYLEHQRELEDAKSLKQRRTDPMGSAMATMRERMADRLLDRLDADPRAAKQLEDAQFDALLHELGAKKDPPKGNAVMEGVSYIAGQLGEGGLSNLFRMVVPPTQREALLEGQLAQVMQQNRNLMAHLQAQGQPQPEPPAQLPPPSATSPADQPPEIEAAATPAADQPAQEAQPEMDWPAMFQRWMGMAPAVAAAEASAMVTKPDEPIRPPWVTATPRQLLGLPADELAALLANNLALRQGVPAQVREFLSTPHGQDYWRQFQAALRLPAPSAAA